MKKLLLMIVMTLLIFTNLPDVLGEEPPSQIKIEEIEDGGEYVEDIIIDDFTEFTYYHNGIVVVTEKVINEVGYHQVEFYTGATLTKTIEFTILPRFAENFDGGKFMDVAVVDIQNEADVYLNGAKFSNVTSLTKYGNYTMFIVGINGYKQTYEFTVESGILEYINDKGVALSSFTVDPENFLEVHLFGELQTSAFRLTDKGTYEISVLGIRGYEKTYHIDLAFNIFNFEDDGVYTGFIKVAKLKAEAVYINGEEIDGLTYITTIGNHEIKYIGVNGYEQVYTVVLKEKDLKIDGKVYESFHLSFKGYTVYLNGKQYRTGTKITNIGNYTLSIHGENGYRSYYNFKVWHKTDIPNNEHLTEAFNINADYKTIYVNGAEVEDYRVTESGDYEVILWGEGGYTERFNFTYENGHIEAAQSLMYVVSGFGGLVIMTYGLVLYRRFK